MKTRYSKTTGTFYPLDINYKELPADIQEVALADYEKAMARPAGATFLFGAAGVLTITPAPVPTLDAIKASLVTAIDGRVAQVYAGWTRFETEYREREAAARKFAAAGYVGDPGVWVSSYATSAGRTTREAADTIIAQSDQLRGALTQLGALRMRKYEITAATTETAARTKHGEIQAAIDVIAAALK